jgi:ribonuclease MRP protein subunit SNM1
MASPELSARLRYLNDSAHLLTTTAPATSRYMMSSCNALMFDRNIDQSETQRRKVCGACGTIMILGWECTVQLESQKRRRKKGDQSKDAPNSSKAIVYKCESCSRETRFPIPLPAPRNKMRSQRQMPSSGTGAMNLLQAKANSTTSTPLSTNASSKKRAKARKQGGLGAILAQKKASEASRSGFGLDLMDFMKKT